MAEELPKGNCNTSQHDLRNGIMGIMAVKYNIQEAIKSLQDAEDSLQKIVNRMTDAVKTCGRKEV